MLVWPKPLDTLVLLGPGISAASERSSQPEIKHLGLSGHSSRAPSIMSRLEILVQLAKMALPDGRCENSNENLMF